MNKISPRLTSITRKRLSALVAAAMVAGIFLLSWKITDIRRRYEGEKAKSILWYDVLTKLHGAVVIVDGYSGLVKEWSPGATAIFGWPAEEALDSDLKFLMTEDKYLAHITAITTAPARARLNGAVVEITCWAFTKSEKQVHVRINVRGVRLDDEYLYVAIIDKIENIVTIPPTPQDISGKGPAAQGPAK